ncbi:MAG: hypothetical protein ACREBI_12135 [Nitrosotalea sp.]
MPAKLPPGEAKRRQRDRMHRYYETHSAEIRAQQSRYNEARRAWKYKKGNIHAELFDVQMQDCPLTIISELELQFPSYKILGVDGKISWELWAPKEKP